MSPLAAPAAPIKETKQQSADMADKMVLRRRSNSVITLCSITAVTLQCYNTVTTVLQCHSGSQDCSSDLGGLDVIHFKGGWLNGQSERGAAEQTETQL